MHLLHKSHFCFPCKLCQVSAIHDRPGFVLTDRSVGAGVVEEESGGAGGECHLKARIGGSLPP